MTDVRKSVVMNYPASSMYALVADTASYPAFLPWCESARMTWTVPGERALASISVNFAGVRQQFSTANTYEENRKITMALKDGPFKSLNGFWLFEPLSENSCRVSLNLSYEFRGLFLNRLIEPVFDMITAGMVDSFRDRAVQIYGKEKP